MLKREFSTSFLVMPKHCNDMYPLIFGGEFMAEIDKAVASTVSEFIGSVDDTEVEDAVTYKADHTFYRPSFSGDIINIFCKVTQAEAKLIYISVQAYRKPRREKKAEWTHVADAQYVFVTRKDNRPYPHKISFEVEKI